MEVKPTILSTWKLFFLGCLCGSLIILLFMDKIQHNTNTLGVKNALVDLTPIVTLFNPVEEPSLNISSMLEEKPTQKGHAECDMFNGRWVYKAEDKPSYNAVTCPFLEIGVTCQKNGRPDFDYAKWRWEATDCDIPL